MKFKIIRIFILLLLGMAPMTGLAQKNMYKNPVKDFSIDFPEGWVYKDNVQGVDVIGLSPRKEFKDGYQDNICVTIEELSHKVSLNDYTAMSILNLNKSLKEFKQLKTGKININGNETDWIIYTFHGGNMNIKVMLFLMVTETKAFVISCSAEEKDFDQYQKEFEQSSKSFRIISDDNSQIIKIDGK
jgi:hypothetical protein